MRLSEKTIELNFCAQAQARYHGAAFWFGLTQRQERNAGFDVASRLGGRLILLQFKASNQVVRSGARRFRLGDQQLRALINRAATGRTRSVFYVLPEIGDTADLRAQRADILRHSWLLDVAALPPIPRPTRADGGLRKHEIHYADLVPPSVTIHSEPIHTSVIRADRFFSEGASGSDGVDPAVLKTGRDRRLRGGSQGPRPFGRGAVGVVLF